VIAGRNGHSPLAGWAPFVVAIALSAVMLGFDLGEHTLTTNDEARFPVMAQDILSKGHWLAPETSGVPMLNKPPLHAWLIALAAWPTGVVTQRAAALPSLLAALGVVAVTCWMARRLFGDEAGLAATLIVATTGGVSTLARSAVPDMTQAFGIAAAMAAFVAAELDGSRAAWALFYTLVGLACWAKGPAGLLPLAVVITYEWATLGWRGITRMRWGMGAVILVLLVAPWWLLAAHVGREQFVQDVVRNDMMQGYSPLRALAWARVIQPLGAVVTILFPWSLGLPFAVRWAVRRWKTESATGERLALVWSLVVFVLIAASSRQRWRYYLPLCVPGALLVAGWLRSRRVGRDTLSVVAAGAVAAGILIVGDIYGLTRDNRATDWRAMARALDRAPAPVFALDAPELVFTFYLDRPIKAISSSAELRGVDPPFYVIARTSPEAASFVAASEGFVRGRRFVLWAKQ
jgi:4-amino-4-deoxy-L-arabinose transferase-like glycosyltransferase